MSKKTTTKSKRYSKDLAQFICDKIADGMTIADISRKYPDEVPKSDTVYQWVKRKDEFREMVDSSYEIWLYRKLEELEYVSTTSREILYPNLEARDAYEARRTRIDALKFLLGKMAPILNKKFDKATKLEVEGDLTPQIMIMNYADGSANELKEAKKGHLISQKNSDEKDL